MDRSQGIALGDFVRRLEMAGLRLTTEQAHEVYSALPHVERMMDNINRGLLASAPTLPRLSLAGS